MISPVKEKIVKIKKPINNFRFMEAGYKKGNDVPLFFRYKFGFVYQRDYPFAWSAATCLAYMGLKRIGLGEDASRIADKYVSTVKNVFEKTGRIWEKYDGLTGEVAVTSECETMPMMGRTAAVYRYFVESER